MSAELRNKINGSCFFCSNWQFSPTLTPQIKDIREKIQKDSYIVNQDLKRVSGMYGKCVATFTDQDGNLQHYDLGSFGITKCFVKDDKGQYLFNQTPIG